MNELHYAIVNLSNWMKPEYVSKNLVGYSNRYGSLVTLTVVDVFTYFYRLSRRRLDWMTVLSKGNLWGSC